LMHIQWNSLNMQDNPEYIDVVKEIWDFFEEKLKIINNYKIKNIIIDVWFGFWKNIKHNYDLLKNLDYFKKFNLPILAWLSRKSMVYRFLDSTPNDVLEETVALNLLALNKWADIIRVHDVKKNKNIIKIFNLMNNL
jgi:dihydropteroate synthase